MFGVFILTTAIGVEVSRSPSSEKMNAYKALSKAIYLETGANKKVKELERKLIPEELKEYGGWITGIVKIANEKKISLEWTF